MTVGHVGLNSDMLCWIKLINISDVFVSHVLEMQNTNSFEVGLT